jgi:hypothetical protein
MAENGTFSAYHVVVYRNLRIPVKVATQTTGKLPPKPVNAATLIGA